MTLDELCVALEGRGVTIHRSNVGGLLHRLGLSHKKVASSQRAPACRDPPARELWIKRRRRFFGKAVARLVFIDETSISTRLSKRTGRAPRGARYRAHAPFGGRKTQTFIPGLRCHAMIAPWIVDAPMNRTRFETYVETQLAPELSPGNVVILDNVA